MCDYIVCSLGKCTTQKSGNSYLLLAYAARLSVQLRPTIAVCLCLVLVTHLHLLVAGGCGILP